VIYVCNHAKDITWRVALAGDGEIRDTKLVATARKFADLQQAQDGATAVQWSGRGPTTHFRLRQIRPDPYASTVHFIRVVPSLRADSTAQDLAERRMTAREERVKGLVQAWYSRSASPSEN